MPLVAYAILIECIFEQVPVACSKEFAKFMEATVPNVPKILSVLDGDHAFDVSLNMQVDWIAEGCDFVLKYW